MTSFTCPRGHRWQQRSAAGVAVLAAAVCPVCGSAADTGLDVVTRPYHPSADAGPCPLISGYEVLGELGRGGMGVVYKARQVRLNRLVALKMIRPGTHAASAQRSRFRVEAEAAARLQHPNIVSVYEVGEDAQGNPYFSLEFVEGAALDKVLARTPQPAREAAALVETLARAVHYAHEQGIVHRDLKPANVLLSFSREPLASAPADALARGSRLNHAVPKVADFGLAKQLDESGQTQSGAILGTPSYMAPEQAAGHSRQVGPAADVHALGVLLYECLTGRPPFHGATVLDTLEQVRTHEPLPPRRLQPAVPRDLDTICLKCLHKEPRKRYPSALELAEDLRRFQQGQPIQARPTPPWERLLKWVRRRPAIAALVAVAVCCVLLGAGEITAEWRQAERERRKAVKATQDFHTAAGEAENARKAAQAATRQRRDDTRKAELAGEQFEEAFALNAVSQAHKDWEAGNVERAGDLLDQCRPDLIRWEWHHLRRLCHVAGLTIPGSGAIAFSPDSLRLAVGGLGQKVDVWDLLSQDAGRPVLVVRDFPGTVQALAYSRDGRYLAAGGHRRRSARGAETAGLVRVFQARSGQPICTLAGHTRVVTGLAFSPDCKRLATAGNDGLVKVWDVPEGKEVFTCKGHTQALRAVAYSPDGRFLASAGDDRSVRLWDPASGRQLRVLLHAAAVTAVAFRPDGKRLVAASWSSVHDWDPASGQRLRTFRSHERCWVEAVAFRPGLAGLPWRLAAGGADGTVRSWDYADGGHTVFRRGHGGAITALAFSPDGARLATWGRDNLIKLWDTASDGACRVVPTGHDGQVSAVAAAPDGRLATAGADGTVKLWDAACRELATLRGHTDMVLSVAFSPDGRRLVSGSADHTARVWDLATRKDVLTFRGHAGDVWSVAFSADGKRIASTSLGQRSCVKVWDAASGKEVRTLEGERASFSPDGKYLASLYQIRDEASQDVRLDIRVWDAATGERVRTFQRREGSLNSLAFTADSRRLVAAGGHSSAYQSVEAWDVASGRQLFVTRRSGRWALAVAPSPDGQRLATANSDGSLGIFDLATGRELLRLRGHRKPATGVSFSRDGLRISTVGADGDLRIWDGSPDGGPHTLRGHADAILSLRVSPDGAWIASASVDATVRLWDVSLRRLVRTLRGHTANVADVAFSPDGRRLASGSYDQTVRVWDLRHAGAAPLIYRGHRTGVRAVAFSPDGKRIASGDAAGGVRVWDAHTGTDLFSLPKRHHHVLQVAFSPDGRLLAVAGGPEGVVLLWDASGGGLRGSLEGHAAQSVNRLAFSPDGRLLASAGGDQTVRVWDVVRHRQRLCYRGHSAPVYGVCFSPDGKRICSSAEGVARIWDTHTGTDVRTVAGHRSFISCVSFTPDGKLVSGSHDTTLKLWP